jgi:hypothetical protein
LLLERGLNEEVRVHERASSPLVQRSSRGRAVSDLGQKVLQSKTLFSSYDVAEIMLGLWTDMRDALGLFHL